MEKMANSDAALSGMKVFVLDNYDSFTYNLVQYLGEFGCDLQVLRNDRVTVSEIERLAPARIVISPGPGTPRAAGISLDLVRSLGGRIPILGVCLGHQAIGEAFGGTVTRAPELKHGKTSMIYHHEDSIFRGVANPFEATRYHSLIVQRSDLPACLIENAWTEDGLLMGIRHREYDVFGVQFHPESILTGSGKQILKNFLCCRD